MLLLQPRAFFPQVIDHAVVDLNQSVHLHLPHLTEAGSEVAVADELGAGIDQFERAEEALNQLQTGDKREREDRFDREQPQPLLQQEVDGYSSKEQVNQDKI